MKYLRILWIMEEIHGQKCNVTECCTDSGHCSNCRLSADSSNI